MIIKIFNVNMKILLFNENKIFELNYVNSFSTNKKYIYGWVFFNSKKIGWVDINTQKKGFQKYKIYPMRDVMLFLEEANHNKNKELNITLDNYDFYYDPKYLSIVPEWLPNNVIQLLNFIENKKVSKIITLSKNDVELRRDLSKLAGFLYQDRESSKKILDFINTYAINISEYRVYPWNNMNEFLYRKLINYPKCSNKKHLYSPVEGLLKIIDEDNFYIKGNKFNFISLVNQKINFNHALLFRMIPSYYHRIHCPYRLKLNNIKRIPGDLYSIRPNTIINNNALINNERYVLTFSDGHDFNLYMVLIGSIFIGSIKINERKLNKWFEPGEEVGYFKFGGSSVVLLLEKDIEYIVNFYKGYETKVDMGTPIGDLKKTELIKYNFDKTVILPNTSKENYIKILCEIIIYLFLIFFYKKFLCISND